jgi:hypothetical protein
MTQHKNTLPPCLSFEASSALQSDILWRGRPLRCYCSISLHHLKPIFTVGQCSKPFYALTIVPRQKMAENTKNALP